MSSNQHAQSDRATKPRPCLTRAHQRVPQNKNKSESPAKEGPSIAPTGPYCHRMSDLSLRGHPEMLNQMHARTNNPLTP